jgi:hypothetical protein
MKKPQPVATGWDTLYADAYNTDSGASLVRGDGGKAPGTHNLEPSAFLHLYTIAHFGSSVDNGDNSLAGRVRAAVCRPVADQHCGRGVRGAQRQMAGIVGRPRLSVGVFLRLGASVGGFVGPGTFPPGLSH